MKKLIYLLVAIVSAFTLSSCTEEAGADYIYLYVSVDTVTVDDDMTLYTGQTFQMTATLTPDDATNPKVYWTVESAEPDGCVTIDSDGNVEAVNEGVATIRATPTGETFYDECVITVVETPIPVVGITMTKEEESITVGEKTTLEYTIDPITPTAGYSVEWSLKDVEPTACAEIDPSTGEITAKAYGTATAVVTITNSEANGGESFSDECELTINVVKVEAIEIPTTLDIAEGAKQSLTYTSITPSGADVTITWEKFGDDTANPAVTLSATTGASITVTGNSSTSGEVTIKATATTADGKFVTSEACAVTVTGEIPYTSFDITVSFSAYVGDKETLAVSNSYPEGANSTVVWSIVSEVDADNATTTDVISLNTSTGEIEALKVGTAVVRATAGSTQCTTDCTITVTEKAIVNLLDNPGFEDGKTIWTFNTNYSNVISISANANNATYVITGDKSAQFSGGSNWNKGFCYQSVAVTKGKTYKYGFTGRVNTINSASGENQQSGTDRSLYMYIQSGDAATEFEDSRLTTYSATNADFSGEITIPSDYKYDIVYVYIQKVYGIGYADDTYFYEK